MADINDAINKAQEAAGEIIDAEVTQETLPATSTGGGQVVSMEKPSMDNVMANSGITNSVDAWLKVNEHGIKIGEEKGLVDSVQVRILMTEDDGFFVKQSIKWGNPVQYASTYDGRVSDKGGSWPDQVARVTSIDPKAKPFPSADIIMTLAKPVKLKDSTVPAGVKLGHTLSMSNFGNWQECYKEVLKAGLLGQEIEITLGAEEVNGKNGYTWGVLTFTLPVKKAA